MSNFGFLQAEFPAVCDAARQAEALAHGGCERTCHARASRPKGSRRFGGEAQRLGVQPATTGIFAIRAFHSAGPVSCTDVPCESTATVTGMSFSVNS